MRTRLNALLPIFLIAIMLGSVAVPQLPNVSDEPVELEEEPVLFETAGRSVPATILAAGSGQANEDGEHIAALPNGGWVVGVSEWTNSTLTYGTHTLSPSSPYNSIGFGEFYLAKMDDKGAWTGFISADHSATTGAGGLSIMTDVAIGMAGEIIVSG